MLDLNANSPFSDHTAEAKCNYLCHLKPVSDALSSAVFDYHNTLQTDKSVVLVTRGCYSFTHHPVFLGFVCRQLSISFFRQHRRFYSYANFCAAFYCTLCSRGRITYVTCIQPGLRELLQRDSALAPLSAFLARDRGYCIILSHKR